MGAVLSLRNICVEYGSIVALRRLSLQLEQGEILGILGPNGSGKSTLLKVMSGMLRPKQGEVLVNATPLPGLGRAQIARAIAMVSQESHFRFGFSVAEVVLMGRFPHMQKLQFEGARDMQVARDALRATQCLEFAKRSILELSGGERQRVLIARALAQEPQVILLDEPTSFLDLRFKREIFQLITALSREQGISVVVVSHDLDLAAQYCSRIAILKNGAIYDSGEPERVITRSNIESVFDCPVAVDQNPATFKPRVTIV